MNNIDIVYTMWENLKKTAAMDVGQVSFHFPKQVRINYISKYSKIDLKTYLLGSKNEN